jgi:predicted ATPase
MHQGLVTQRTLGAQVHVSGDLAKLAEAYGQVGQANEGLRLITEALAMVARTGEHYYEAELYRLKGELLLALAGKEQQLTEAETSFHQALEVARCQQAKLPELLVAMILSLLWQQHC